MAHEDDDKGTGWISNAEEQPIKPSTKYIPPHRRQHSKPFRVSPPRASPSRAPQDLIQHERRYNKFLYPQARFLGVELFQEGRMIGNDSIILSMNYNGSEAIMKNNAPGRVIRLGDERRLKEARDLPSCMSSYGGFKNWPPDNSYVSSDMLWGPSHDRGIVHWKHCTNAFSSERNTGQCHNMILGVLSGENASFEINEERSLNMSSYDLNEAIKKLLRDDHLKSMISERFLVYRSPLRMIAHEYEKHGFRGYFTLRNYIELMLDISMKHSLESLLQEADCMPLAGDVKVFSLNDLQRKLDSAFGKKVRLRVVWSDNKYFLSSIEFWFHLNGVKMDHGNNSVQGLNCNDKDVNVEIYIESIQWRKENEGKV